ncbi:DUF4348 domain-containing protein [Flavobacterium branchiicola]|uniref:DUF4348 domain-containing protein n=1 Tax=Flavobacterium branchiicola TaxID=1114875 RepID=A0ABV9PC20_9FLAO|nr:DUF4348 domain-containing protein [Flavobacterium branchiicola]MBS7253944.1 DUF4348 domain-containing protein [Flavobacterium branchiicola]
MKKNLFFMFFAFVMLFGSAALAQNSDTTKEDFNSFFNKFNSDSKFQLSRVIFPLNVKQNNDDLELENFTVSKEKYSVLHLNKKASKIDYTQKVILHKSKAVIQLRGIDNGIYIDYIFELKNNIWELKTWSDMST